MGLMFLFLFTLVLCFGIAVFRGAPYLPTFSRDIEEIINQCNLKAGDRLVDLGSGDGKVLVAAAKRGIHATGYEINPILWLISSVRLWPYREIASVRLASMWRADVVKADVVFIFLLDRLMSKMEKKLSAEMGHGSIVASYVFKFSSRKEIWKTRNAYGYKF